MKIEPLTNIDVRFEFRDKPPKIIKPKEVEPEDIFTLAEDGLELESLSEWIA